MSNVSQKKISNYHHNNDVIQVKTKPPQTSSAADEQRHIDISSITTSSDLDTLSKVDPFLYHSIPSIYKSKLSCELVDHSQVIHEEHRHNVLSSIQRKTRMSTECHSILLLEDLLVDGTSIDGGIASSDDVRMDDVMMFGDSYSLTMTMTKISSGRSSCSSELRSTH